MLSRNCHDDISPISEEPNHGDLVAISHRHIQRQLHSLLTTRPRDAQDHQHKQQVVQRNRVPHRTQVQGLDRLALQAHHVGVSLAAVPPHGAPQRVAVSRRPPAQRFEQPALQHREGLWRRGPPWQREGTARPSDSLLHFSDSVIVSISEVADHRVVASAISKAMKDLHEQEAHHHLARDFGNRSGSERSALAPHARVPRVLFVRLPDDPQPVERLETKPSDAAIGEPGSKQGGEAPRRWRPIHIMWRQQNSLKIPGNVSVPESC
mmetsp:Transcript_64988/g.164702  ORF Transcript_64988/g.164702 Transcript_64988/m.164702 type:complete len:265 (-) Transcript_64988:65-859(-)